MKTSQFLGVMANHTYLFSYTMPDGANGYVYLMCPLQRERELSRAMTLGEIPDFARVIACGRGAPNERLRLNMERYYGHIHERLAA